MFIFITKYPGQKYSNEVTDIDLAMHVNLYTIQFVCQQIKMKI